MNLGERYELLEEVGRGASGVVYRAKEIESGREVAVKLVRPARGRQSLSRQQQERLRREAKILAKIRHPGIVEVIDARIEASGAYLVTEFVRGQSLQDRLVCRGRLDVAEAVSLVVQAAHALAAAHRQGVIHRDVKPANLLVGNDGRLRIVDFGVAWEPAGESSPQGGEYLMGTPAYVAPEQLQGGPVDGRADLYSLAVVFFRCLTGERPFEGSSVGDVIHRVLHEDAPPPSVHRADLPKEIDDLCRRALARDPQERPRGVLEFARALEEISVPPSAEGACARGGDEARGICAIDATFDQRVAPPPSRRRRAGIAAILLTIVLLWSAHRTLERGERVAAEGSKAAIAEKEPWRKALRSACPDASSSACREAWARILATDPSDEEAFRMLAETKEQKQEKDDSLLSPGTKIEKPASAAPKAPIVASSKREKPAPAMRIGVPETAAVRLDAREKKAPAPELSAGAHAQERKVSPRSPVSPKPRPARQSLTAVNATLVKTTGRIEIEHGLEEGMMEIHVDGRRVSLVSLDARTNDGVFTVSPGRHVLSLRVMSATRRIDVEKRWKQVWVRGENAQRRFALRREPESDTWSLERVP